MKWICLLLFVISSRLQPLHAKDEQCGSKGQIGLVEGGTTRCLDRIDVFAQHDLLTRQQLPTDFPTFSFNLTDIHYQSEEMHWIMQSMAGEEVIEVQGHLGQKLKIDCGISGANRSLATRIFGFTWRYMTVFGWMGFDPWAKKIDSSDGQNRLLWLHNLQRIVEAGADDRVRSIGDRLYLSIYETELSGHVFTCWKIDEGVGRRQAKHYRLAVVRYSSSWFDTNNPLMWLKWTILVGYLAFIGIAWWNYHQGGFKEDTRQELQAGADKR